MNGLKVKRGGEGGAVRGGAGGGEGGGGVSAEGSDPVHSRAAAEGGPGREGGRRSVDALRRGAPTPRGVRPHLAFSEGLRCVRSDASSYGARPAGALGPTLRPAGVGIYPSGRALRRSDLGD